MNDPGCLTTRFEVEVAKERERKFSKKKTKMETVPFCQGFKDDRATTWRLHSYSMQLSQHSSVGKEMLRTADHRYLNLKTFLMSVKNNVLMLVGV